MHLPHATGCNGSILAEAGRRLVRWEAQFDPHDGLAERTYRAQQSFQVFAMIYLAEFAISTGTPESIARHGYVQRNSRSGQFWGSSQA